MRLKVLLLLVAGVLLLSGCGRFGFAPDDPVDDPVEPLAVEIFSVDTEYPYVTVVGCITGGERPYSVAYDCDTTTICPPGDLGPCAGQVPCPPCPPEEEECCFEVVCDYTCSEGEFVLTITVIDDAGTAVVKQVTVDVEKPAPVYHTVTFEDYDGTTLKSEQVLDGEDATPPAEPTREGYEFTGWDTDYTNVTEDLVVTALYEEDDLPPPPPDEDLPPPPPGEWYVITASAGEGGSISPSGNVTVPEGASRKFTITPDEGYVIDDVVVDGESVGDVTSYTFEDVADDHTIFATFEEAATLYELALSIDAEGVPGVQKILVTIGDDTVEYKNADLPTVLEIEAGTWVMLEATPGGRFVEWLGAGPGATDPVISGIVNTDLSITAVFE